MKHAKPILITVAIVVVVLFAVFNLNLFNSKSLIVGSATPTA